MIFVSSSCVKKSRIRDSIEHLALDGFKNIELSGGTELYDGYVEDLLELKENYSLEYMCHNYFPPPKDHFVLNLASEDSETYDKSFAHFTKAIDLSKKLGAKRYGFHAGFLIDIKVSEIGKRIAAKVINGYDQGVERFFDSYNQLQDYAGNDLQLYVENNVLSAVNYESYGQRNPFILTHSDEFFKLQNAYTFNLLLDVAHLYVSAHTLGFDFQEELDRMAPHSDYHHMSYNNGLSDENKGFSSEAQLKEYLCSMAQKPCTVTMEIYESDTLLYNYKLLKSLYLL